MKIFKLFTALALSALLASATLAVGANAAGDNEEVENAVLTQKANEVNIEGPKAETEPVTEAEPQYEEGFGDVNADGVTDDEDVIILRECVAKLNSLSGAQLSRAKIETEEVGMAQVNEVQKAADSNPPVQQTAGLFAQSVHVNLKSATLLEGQSLSLTSTVTPDNAVNGKLVYSSSNESVMTVTASGKVTAVKEGKATVTVKTEDGTVRKTCIIDVEPVSNMGFSGFKKLSGNAVNKGTAANLSGKVKSNVPLTSVTCEITGTKMRKTVTFSEDDNVLSYNISKMAETIKLSSPSAGKYTLNVYATDVQSAYDIKLYSYTYTVKGKTLSENLKNYTSGGVVYNVPTNFKEDYLYEQRDYHKFDEGGTNVGCSAVAEAMGASIIYNKKILPTNKLIGWTYGGATFELASGRLYNCSVQKKLSTAYSELLKGKPTLINTLGGSDHWLTVVGVKKSADKNNLKPSDFLIANPWGAYTENFQVYLDKTSRYIPNSYSLRTF
ncbi:MAG: Ig-like domain-containing protein [Acutalibacteraceae bacterium]